MSEEMEKQEVELDLDEVEKQERELEENEKRLDALCTPLPDDDAEIAKVIDEIRVQREAISYMRREVESMRYDVGKVRSMNAIDRKKLEELEQKKKPLRLQLRNALIAFAAGLVLGFIFFAIIHS